MAILVSSKMGIDRNLLGVRIMNSGGGIAGVLTVGEVRTIQRQGPLIIFCISWNRQNVRSPSALQRHFGFEDSDVSFHTVLVSMMFSAANYPVNENSTKTLLPIYDCISDSSFVYVLINDVICTLGTTV